jgi:hypothetical protein
MVKHWFSMERPVSSVFQAWFLFSGQFATYNNTSYSKPATFAFSVFDSLFVVANCWRAQTGKRKSKQICKLIFQPFTLAINLLFP